MIVFICDSLVSDHVLVIGRVKQPNQAPEPTRGIGALAACGSAVTFGNTMRTVIAAPTQTLVSLTRDEVGALANSLNEVLHNSTMDEDDCHTRIGVSIEALRVLLKSLHENLDLPRATSAELFQAWGDEYSIQLKAISAFGDPADLSAAEVKQVLMPLIEAAEKL